MICKWELLTEKAQAVQFTYCNYNDQTIVIQCSNVEVRSLV